jgi:hypothetical protein
MLKRLHPRWYVRNDRRNARAEVAATTETGLRRRYHVQHVTLGFEVEPGYGREWVHMTLPPRPNAKAE